MNEVTRESSDRQVRAEIVVHGLKLYDANCTFVLPNGIVFILHVHGIEFIVLFKKTEIQIEQPERVTIKNKKRVCEERERRERNEGERKTKLQTGTAAEEQRTEETTGKET